MQLSKLNLVAVAIVASATKASAFVPQSSNAIHEKTSLYAMPPMIIGPMIRKMREEKEKKNMPMASEDEAVAQAPGLRVGGSAWKWPPIWPYDREFFTPTEDVPKPDPTKQMGGVAGMAGMLSGVPQIPTPDEVEIPEVDALDVLTYWSVEKADVRTELDEEAAEKLKNHFGFYLKPGMSILELGAAEQSYLPDNINPSRHVGVGLNKKLMGENPSLSEQLVVDLNKVVPERDVESDELRKLASEPFDAIIMTNTMEYLTNPREVYRSAHNLLKPGGVMINAFSNRKAFSDKFERAQVRMWRDFNDDQHMWIAGSFYQFSAGDGWANLLGFDISPESAKKALQDDGPLNLFKKGKDNNMYVVQATKEVQDEVIDEKNPSKSIGSKMWMMPILEERDKQLVIPRLTRAFTKAKTEEQKQSVGKNVALLPQIFEALIKMDQFSFNFQMQSQLAADLVLDPDFDANDAQLDALKRGLGLRTPTPEFWEPVGVTTANMIIEDKINLLSHLVPRFGSGNPEQEAALTAFATGLKPTMDLIREKCPDLPESDLELLGTELLCAEILIPGRSTKQEFAEWLGAMTESDLKEILAFRKSFNEESSSEFNAYKEELAEQERQRNELKRKYEEQIKKAREERTMGFNPATGKFQEFPKKEEKK